jgi:hypothetical protein
LEKNELEARANCISRYFAKIVAVYFLADFSNPFIDVIKIEAASKAQ